MFEFEVQKPSNLLATIAVLRNEAAKHNVQVVGNDMAGKCSGYGFSGRYEICLETVRITVYKRPVFISESRIIGMVRKYLKKCNK